MQINTPQATHVTPVQLQQLGCIDNKNIFPQTISQLINESVKKVFVQQPRLHRVCLLKLRPHQGIIRNQGLVSSDGMGEGGDKQIKEVVT